jgi:hypothetical protein
VLKHVGVSTLVYVMYSIKAVSKHVYEAVEFEYPHKHKLRAAKPVFLEEADL